MTELGGDGLEPPPEIGRRDSLHKSFEQSKDASHQAVWQLSDEDLSSTEGNGDANLTESTPRKVITGLPRSQTFERKLAEQREHLEPVPPTADERRAASVDRRASSLNYRVDMSPYGDPRSSAPGLLGSSRESSRASYLHSLPVNHDHYELSSQPTYPASLDSLSRCDEIPPTYATSVGDTPSVTASQQDAIIAEELERRWILNLSMHFRDRSKREKFFVTYREKDNTWRRVTISLDYRDAPPNSLEMDLIHTRYQRQKSAKIYEAIRDSLCDIQFYDTVTNLKLQTTDGRLHVHVVEDGNEIIQYPNVDQIRHLRCRRIRERDIVFDSHMSGFVYKVHIHGRVLIKKEIPSPETVEEFLYEINALSSLAYAKDVVQLYGIVVDDYEEYVKGLLISYAQQGALIDIIYDNCKEQNHGIPWSTREKWAKQIVQGLSDIHESGFVQGDFTLSNIVVDESGDAKIIDINRRGCPVGWEPPEATALIEAHHRITMYIGIKSDLYQLGMVLWGLAMLEDEPETHGRPLMLGPEINIPDWYRQMTEICLSTDPRMRLQATSLLQMFPPGTGGPNAPTIAVNDAESEHAYSVDYSVNGEPYVRTVDPSDRWPHSSRTHFDASPDMFEHYYPPRGRSPPSPLPSNLDRCESPNGLLSSTSWAANKSVRPSYSDVSEDDKVAHGTLLHAAARRIETPVSMERAKSSHSPGISAGLIEDESSSQPLAVGREDSISLGDGLRAISTPRLSRQDTVVHLSRPQMDASDSLTRFTNDEQPELLGSEGQSCRPTESIATSETHEGMATTSEVDGGVPIGKISDSTIIGTTSDRQVNDNVAGRCLPAEDLRPRLETHHHERTEKFRGEGALPASGNADKMCNESAYPRHMSLPLSLAGVGAGLRFDNGPVTESANFNDEFNKLARPATVQALMITTDPPR